MDQKTAGILLHITSLSNHHFIGDLGPAANVFVDFMSQSNQRWWQMLPIGPTGKDNSPYQTTSAFAGNPLLISPERLVEQGFLNSQDIEFSTSLNNGKVNYPKAIQLKHRLLKKAFKNFEKETSSDRQSELNAFARTESAWLDDFSLFSAIQNKEGTPDWTQWESKFRLRNPNTLVRAKKYLAKDIRYHQFVQWQFSIQWQTLRLYCKKNGIKLIGDVPLFVAHHSPDVWAHPDIFKLDNKGRPTVIAGVPPDCFSDTGQMWNVPVYRWDVLRAQSYSWWIERLRTVLQRFDIIRLDHFIGFIRTYEVLAGAKTAIHGQYHLGGGLSFFKTVHKALGLLPFIADDLGAITSEVEALRNQLEIPGTRVLQFELATSIETNIIPPKQYPTDSVVYTGTHDNDTTIGWYRKLPSKQRKALNKQLNTLPSEFNWAMIRTALTANSNTAIIPMQDILGLGSEARMNVPGKMKDNWQWRMKKNVLTKMLTQKMKKLTQTFERNEIKNKGWINNNK
jgi:4-alpha-glucanotransferase